MIAAAERELGVTFRPVDETLRDVIAWYRERGWIEEGRGVAQPLAANGTDVSPRR